MATAAFPALPLAEWRATRDTLQAYVTELHAIRAALTPSQKHFAHHSLRAGIRGITTPPIPAGADANAHRFSLTLDLNTHAIVLDTDAGEHWQAPLIGQSPEQFRRQMLDALDGFGIRPRLEARSARDETTGYDAAHAQRFWLALRHVDMLFRQFKGELREETSPVQLWAEHFDLAMLWFSGRTVPGAEPGDESYADEQMNFGFSTGDEHIGEAYFYITAYPLPDALPKLALPRDAYWQRDGFQGAILPYRALLTAGNAAALLLQFLRDVQSAGAQLMR